MILLAVESPPLQQHVVRCLDAIGLRWRLADPASRAPIRRKDLVIAGAPRATGKRVVADHALWIGAEPMATRVSGSAKGKGEGMFLERQSLTASELFAAIYREGLQDVLVAHLTDLLAAVPEATAIVQLFGEKPSQRLRLRDLALAWEVGVGTVHELVEDLGFRRLEHLDTWLRAETWIWLVRQGITRRLVERFLGIHDRSNFRRGCQRAGIAVPWKAR